MNGGIISEQKKNEFLAKLRLLMKEYNVVISHEDYHGCFILEEYSENEFMSFCINMFVRRKK